jgi:uncharacterized protein
MRIVLPGNRLLEVALNGGAAAAQLAAALPQELSLSRWGDGEYYGTLSVPVSSREARRDVFEAGEVALWPDGNAFCIFFGPTPASEGDEPRMASPGIPLGRIVSDLAVLATLGPRLRVTLAPAGLSRRDRIG